MNAPSIHPAIIERGTQANCAIAANNQQLAMSARKQLIDEYIRHGWKLCAIPPGTKGPTAEGWNLPENALTLEHQLPPAWGVGLLHAHSGTCALDVDNLDLAAGWFALRGIDLNELLNAPDAVQITSGTKGRAKLIYQVPFPLPTKKVIVDKDGGNVCALELRCAATTGNSMQDVLPPSRHPSGTFYEWGGKGNWKDLPMLPEAFMTVWQELIKGEKKQLKQPKQPHQSAGNSSTLGITLEQLPDLLEYLNPDCDYRDWSSVLAGCRHQFGDGAQEIVRKWSKESKKYPDDKKFDQFWRSWKQDKEGGITFGSVVQLALEGGWTHPAPDIKGMFSPVPEAPAAKLPMWDSTPLPDTSATPPPFPDPFPGVMRELFDAALPFSHKEQPELMTAAILSGMASGITGHYFYGNDARCNQYFIGVCETAGGKEFPRQIGERIADMAGANVIGAAASGPGIEDALTPFGNLMMAVDEIGFLFAATNAKNAQSHLTGLKSILLKLFSVSRGTFNSRNKAGLPGKKIAHPCMNVLGFTTPEILGRSMKESDIASGELPRYMLVFGRDGVRGRMVRGRFLMPKGVADMADRIRIAASFAKGTGNTIEITSSEDGWNALNEQFERYEGVRASTPFTKALVSRAYEKCERVAMTLAVWTNPTAPTIDRAMVDWAGAFVDYSNLGLVNFAERHMVAATSIANAKDVLEKAQRIIKGEFETRNMNEARIIKVGLVPWSMLLNKSRLPTNDFRDAIDYLVQSECVEIITQQFELAASGGSKTVRALRILGGL